MSLSDLSMQLNKIETTYTRDKQRKKPQPTSPNSCTEYLQSLLTGLYVHEGEKMECQHVQDLDLQRTSVHSFAPRSCFLFQTNFCILLWSVALEWHILFIRSFYKVMLVNLSVNTI